jgi:hypothetical protein
MKTPQISRFGLTCIDCIHYKVYIPTYGYSDDTPGT